MAATQLGLPVVHITTFPPEHCGIGNATFGLLEAADFGRRHIVLGNVVEGTVQSKHEVHRVWKKNNFFYPFQILRALRSVGIPPRSIAHVQHHFFLYGRAPTALGFPFLLLVLRICGCKIVVQLHSVVDYRALERDIGLRGTTIRPSRAAPLLKSFYRVVDLFSDRIIVWTQEMSSKLKSLYGTADSKVRIAPFGWETKPTRRDSAEKYLGKEGGMSIVFHGFLDPTKGLEVLLFAFSRIADRFPLAHLFLVGEPSPHLSASHRGEYLEDLRGLATTLGIGERVRITGYVREEVLDQYLDAASMIVLPYTTVASVAGSVVLSRIAGLGKPLVASRIPRFASELVSGRDALLVEPGNIDELALAVTRIANDHELARSLGENLRRLSEERSWNRTAALVNLVYQELERQ